ncbi:MAG: glycosyltransferase [Candidatus Omnitrophica bacterium]|nr:glycosyltransferase [Candidatus Omnitrophota bacterium]
MADVGGRRTEGARMKSADAVPSHVFVVIPAYNEALNLPALLTGVHQVLAAQQESMTLIVVDDGSEDETAEVVRQLAVTRPIELLRHAQNRGVGAVFRTGFSAACAQAAPHDVIVLMEGDGTSDPAVLPAMLGRIHQGADLVIGSRYRPGGGYGGFSVRRMALSLGANLLLRLRFPMAGVRDYTIFFRAYRAGLLQRGFQRFGERLTELRTFACNAELLIKLRALRPNIAEVPLRYCYGVKRGRSKLAVRRTIAEYLAFMATARTRPWSRLSGVADGDEAPSLVPADARAPQEGVLP